MYKIESIKNANIFFYDKHVFLKDVLIILSVSNFAKVIPLLILELYKKHLL